MGIYCAVLLFFALCPLSAAEEGLFVCPSRLFGRQCFGCGMTRAFLSVMKGDLSGAFSYHGIFTAVLFPALLLLMGQDLFVILTRRPLSVVEYLWRGGRK
ncbi:MAG: DUF2752 domain-containing protein [Clostridia bacterium]|nr:DUF2752 domain-containing protein [Clostridia bacterium]